MCASDGYTYERARIQMYMNIKLENQMPVVSPMDVDTVRALPPTHARPFVGVSKSQFSNMFQETGALLGQKLTKAHQWLQERT